jgi:hypothetical protein
VGREKKETYFNPIIIGGLMANKPVRPEIVDRLAKRMQKSKKTTKQNKHFPVQNHILWGAAQGSGLQVLRTDYALSALNRRLYRQNKVYRVKLDVVGNRAQVIDVFRLRDTFMLQRGYELAMEEWNKSYDEAGQVVKDNVRARWRDFRIDPKSHVGDTIVLPRNLRGNGSAAASTNVVVDEYNYSESYTPGGLVRDFGLKSDSNTFDIIAEYNKVGKVQTEPSVATTEAAYQELQTDLTDDMVENLQEDGNNPPYDADEHHVLDVLEYVGTIYIDDDGTSKSTTGFFDAPLGVVYLSGTGSTIAGIDGAAANFYKMTVQKGQYKGVAARDYVGAKKLE